MACQSSPPGFFSQCLSRTVVQTFSKESRLSCRSCGERAGAWAHNSGAASKISKRCIIPRYSTARDFAVLRLDRSHNGAWLGAYSCGLLTIRGAEPALCELTVRSLAQRGANLCARRILCTLLTVRGAERPCAS